MKNPIITFKVEGGDIIKAGLYPEITPNTVNNFISLVNRGFHNRLIFHRIISGFMIQGGCPDGSGIGDSGYSVKGGFSQNGFANRLKRMEGVLSMARATDPNFADSQLSIMHKSSPHLGGAYAAFGEVIEGIDVVSKITDVRTDYNDCPTKKRKLKSVAVDTFGETRPEPEKC